MNKIVGLSLIAFGFAIGLFIGKNQRLVRETGRRFVALKDDVKGLAQSAGEWVERGKAEIDSRREDIQGAASAVVSAYEKLTA